MDSFTIFVLPGETDKRLHESQATTSTEYARSKSWRARRKFPPAAEIEKMRSRYPNAYEKWTEADDQELMQMGERGVSKAEMAKRFGRKRSAITSRLKKLEFKK